MVLVWDQNETYSMYEDQPSADQDLEVRDPFSAVVASSFSLDNTYELVGFTAGTTGTHTIRIVQARCDLTPSFIAVAFGNE